MKNDIKYNKRIEYMVYDDTEIFVLIDKQTNERNCLNKYEFLSSFITILNLNNEEFTNLEYHIKTLKYILPIKYKPYTKEKILIDKAKKYIDKAISTPFYATYETFKLACELKYFRDISSHQFHDLSSLDIKSNNTPTDDFEKIDYIYKLYKKNMGFLTSYELKTFEDFIVASIMELFKNKKRIKKCLNCGKYFIAGRSDTSYCSNPSPQNENKTCSKFMTDEKYQNNLAENDTQRLYRKIYKRLNQHKKRTNYTPVIRDFEIFTNEAKEWKQKIKNGETTEEEYFEWLKQEDTKKRK